MIYTVKQNQNQTLSVQITEIIIHVGNIITTIMIHTVKTGIITMIIIITDLITIIIHVGNIITTIMIHTVAIIINQTLIMITIHVFGIMTIIKTAIAKPDTVKW